MEVGDEGIREEGKEKPKLKMQNYKIGPPA
jgi:hypothetical protein